PPAACAAGGPSPASRQVLRNGHGAPSASRATTMSRSRKRMLLPELGLPQLSPCGQRNVPSSCRAKASAPSRPPCPRAQAPSIPCLFTERRLRHSLSSARLWMRRRPLPLAQWGLSTPCGESQPEIPPPVPDVETPAHPSLAATCQRGSGSLYDVLT